MTHHHAQSCHECSPQDSPALSREGSCLTRKMNDAGQTAYTADAQRDAIRSALAKCRRRLCAHIASRAAQCTVLQPHKVGLIMTLSMSWHTCQEGYDCCAAPHCCDHERAAQSADGKTHHYLQSKFGIYVCSMMGKCSLCAFNQLRCCGAYESRSVLMNLRRNQHA